MRRLYATLASRRVVAATRRSRVASSSSSSSSEFCGVTVRGLFARVSTVTLNELLSPNVSVVGHIYIALPIKRPKVHYRVIYI